MNLDDRMPVVDVMRRARDLQTIRDSRIANRCSVPAIPVTEAECAAAEPLIEIRREWLGNSWTSSEEGQHITQFPTHCVND